VAVDGGWCRREQWPATICGGWRQKPSPKQGKTGDGGRAGTSDCGGSGDGSAAEALRRLDWAATNGRWPAADDGRRRQEEAEKEEAGGVHTG